MKNLLQSCRYKIKADEPWDCDIIIPKLKDESISANLEKHVKRQHRQTLDAVSKQHSQTIKKIKFG